MNKSSHSPPFSNMPPWGVHNRDSTRIQICFDIDAWTLIKGDCPHFIYFQMMPFLRYFDKNIFFFPKHIRQKTQRKVYLIFSILGKYKYFSIFSRYFCEKSIWRHKMLIFARPSKSTIRSPKLRFWKSKLGCECVPKKEGH